MDNSNKDLTHSDDRYATIGEGKQKNRRGKKRKKESVSDKSIAPRNTPYKRQRLTMTDILNYDIDES